MNRFKIFLLLLIIAILATLFIQNTEPIALKLLCEDPNSQYCLYQTPQLPTSVWISLFIVGGCLTNLLSQAFNRYSYSGSSKKRYRQDDLYVEKTNWVDRDTQQKKYSTAPTEREDNIGRNKADDSDIYEADQKPQEVERSGSNYSYKYRPAEQDKKSKRQAENASIDLDKNTDLTSESEDEDWI